MERLIEFYNLDMIISVGYRVNSKQATKFRIWATNILKKYLTTGIVVNEKKLHETKLKELENTLNLVKKAIESKKLTYDEQAGLLSVITDYADSWLLLEAYDKEKLKLPKGKKKAHFKIEFDRIKDEIKVLKEKLIQKKEATDLFGNERDQGLKSIIGNLYQTFDKQELYPTIEEKAAHLLYFIIKDHPFTDGNKRIGSFLFILFLKGNHCLFDKKGQNKINDKGLVALALMVAQSDPKDKENMIKLITNLIA